MPNVNIYLPDELADDVAAAKDRLNVSAVCQRALKEELAVLKMTDTTEFEKLEHDVEDPRSGIIRTLTFQGRWLVAPDEDQAVLGYTYGIALTKRGRIAITISGHGHDALRDYDDLDDVVGVPAEFVADARAVLNNTVSVVELDI